MSRRPMTVGEALATPTTALGRAAAMLNAQHAERLAAARAIVDAEGVTLEDALARVWASTYHRLEPEGGHGRS